MDPESILEQHCHWWFQHGIQCYCLL